jgi:transcriptional regulator with XRE-family HTH domain
VIKIGQFFFTKGGGMAKKSKFGNVSFPGRGIQRVRYAKKMTQLELSALTGFSQSYISNAESGTIFSICEKNLQTFAKALDVNAEVFSLLAIDTSTLPAGAKEPLNKAQDLVLDKLSTGATP